MGTVVLHPYALDGGAQDATWEALDAVRRWGAVAVLDAPCDDWGDYARWLVTLWGKGHQLLIVEHDLVVTVETIAGLVGCRQPVCAQAYQVHGASTGLEHSRVVHQVRGEHGLEPASLGAEFTDAFGLGCTLLRREFQAAVPPQTWAGSTWRELDTVLSAQMRRRGMRCHVHWPEIRHLHGDLVGVMGG